MLGRANRASVNWEPHICILADMSRKDKMCNLTFEAYDFETEQERQKLPVCDECGERIDTDFWDINGLKLCVECMASKRVHLDLWLEQQEWEVM